MCVALDALFLKDLCNANLGSALKQAFLFKNAPVGGDVVAKLLGGLFAPLFGVLVEVSLEGVPIPHLILNGPGALAGGLVGLRHRVPVTSHDAP